MGEGTKDRYKEVCWIVYTGGHKYLCVGVRDWGQAGPAILLGDV